MTKLSRLRGSAGYETSGDANALERVFFGVLPRFFLHEQKKWGNIAQVLTWENHPRRSQRD